MQLYNLLKTVDSVDNSNHLKRAVVAVVERIGFVSGGVAEPEAAVPVVMTDHDWSVECDGTVDDDWTVGIETVVGACTLDAS